MPQLIIEDEEELLLEEELEGDLQGHQPEEDHIHCNLVSRYYELFVDGFSIIFEYYVCIQAQ